MNRSLTFPRRSHGARPLALRALQAVASWLALLLLAAPLAAQSDQEFVPPEDLRDFWSRFQSAKVNHDDDGMDAAVRGDRKAAIDTLDILLDDLCRKDNPLHHGEARSLAWAIDRVERTERYIERVRSVIAMDMDQRALRRRAFRDYATIEAKLKTALDDRSEAGMIEVYGELDALKETFQSLGDREVVITILSQQAEIEAARGRPWERAVILKELVAQGDQLGYRDPLVDIMRQTLAELVLTGFDPDGERPADAPSEAEVATANLGRTLTSWAPDSRSETFPFEPVDPKKGLEGFDIPTFHPFEQYQLWPLAWVEAENPTPFDQQRGTVLMPHGKRWSMAREGILKFTLDADGDGQADVSFSPSTTPSRVDVPGPDGSEPYPLWVCILSDREKLFSVETNYAPTVEFARLRFSIGRHLEGKVLGETWKVFDATMDGSYGVAVENFDDLVTRYAEDNHVSWFDTDAALVGKAKRATPLSSVMPVGDTFYRTEFDPSGASVTVRELALETGKVKVDIALKTQPSHLTVREVGGKLEGAFFDILPERKGGTVTLPVGTYEIASGRIVSGKKTSLDQARIYRGRSTTFVVEKGKTVELELGAPFDLTFSTKQIGEERVLESNSLRIFGRGGEEYAMLFDEALQPEVDVRNASEHRVEKGKLRLADMEQWQNAGNDGDRVLWFPQPYAVQNPRNETMEFKLTQKAHTLLGGPFESAWIR